MAMQHLRPPSEGESGENQPSAGVGDQIKKATEAAIEFWAERSAVREFDGLSTRDHAEYRAAIETKKKFGFLPDEINNAINWKDS